MTIQSAQQLTQFELKKLYDEREVSVISDWILESITNKKKIDRILEKDQLLSENQIIKLTQILSEVANHKPIQYILEEAWFAGMKFYVNESTLIPRPETEELVNWIMKDFERVRPDNNLILDIGTGSGCIPITLKKKLPEFTVMSIDVSNASLKVAQQNATALETDISLWHIDFLQEQNWEEIPIVEIIVSNPPYIRFAEKKEMSKHVVDFEPNIALFVPDEDPLIFYRKIAEFGKTHLSHTGNIYVEINEMLGNETVNLFYKMGYQVEIRKDLQGKDRMLRASLTTPI